MLVKVCGMRDPENIRAVAGLGIDLMGFIFWAKSPRNAGNVLQPESSHLLPETSHLKKVGVFVNELPQNVIRKVHEYHLDYVQLHGSESAAYIAALRGGIPPDVSIIKAISVHDADDVGRWREYYRHADMLLFDTKCTCAGGSGRQFDWSVLARYDGDIPFLLSGGIGPDDAGRVKAFRHPMLAGIDLNSRFEDAPGVKNVDRLRKFINTIRNEQDKQTLQ